MMQAGKETVYANGLRLVGRGLDCERGGRIVYRGVDLDVARGAALIIRGPNGAGKSSLLRQIAGLVALAGGSLVLEGAPPELTRQEQLHYIGHQEALKPALSVAENLSFWAGFLGTDTELGPSLQAFALEPLLHMPAAYLSAGQKRRVALTLLLLAPRPLWLLDEPSVGLDRDNLQRLQSLMQAHLARGGMIIAATHQELGLPEAAILDLGLAAGAASSEGVPV